MLDLSPLGNGFPLLSGWYQLLDAFLKTRGYVKVSVSFSQQQHQGGGSVSPAAGVDRRVEHPAADSIDTPGGIALDDSVDFDTVIRNLPVLAEPPSCVAAAREGSIELRRASPPPSSGPSLQGSFSSASASLQSASDSRPQASPAAAATEHCPR